MHELPKKDVFIVDDSNKAAKSLMVKICKNAKPGAVIFVTKEEFEVLRNGVIRLETPESEG